MTNIVFLLPKDKRLKQLIKEHGEKWDIIKFGNPVCFCDSGIFIQSTDGKDHKRWVRPNEVEFSSDFKLE